VTDDEFLAAVERAANGVPTQGFHFGRPDAADKIDRLLTPVDPDPPWEASNPDGML